jgi:DnaJ like chaperone protein
MPWWGTLLGGTLGFMFGGPLGALLGAALGRNFDRGIKITDGQHWAATSIAVSRSPMSTAHLVPVGRNVSRQRFLPQPFRSWGTLPRQMAR